MAEAGSSSASAARRGQSTTSSASPAGCRAGVRGCAPALGRLVRKLRRQSRLLCAARHHGAASSSSSARCCHQYDPLSYSRNFDFGTALDGNEACSFASRFVLAAGPTAARQAQ